MQQEVLQWLSFMQQLSDEDCSRVQGTAGDLQASPILLSEIQSTKVKLKICFFLVCIFIIYFHLIGPPQKKDKTTSSSDSSTLILLHILFLTCFIKLS